MEPRPPFKGPAVLTCKACAAPLGWLSGDRRRFRVIDGAACRQDADTRAVAVACPHCGRERPIRGGRALFVTID